MLEFRNIDISDKPRIDAALAESQFMGCEYSFANNMAWRRLAESKSLSSEISTSAVLSERMTVFRILCFLPAKAITEKS